MKWALASMVIGALGMFISWYRGNAKVTKLKSWDEWRKEKDRSILSYILYTKKKKEKDNE